MKTWKLVVPGLFKGTSPMAGEFPAQKASNAENVFEDVIMNEGGICAKQMGDMQHMRNSVKIYDFL